MKKTITSMVELDSTLNHQAKLSLEERLKRLDDMDAADRRHMERRLAAYVPVDLGDDEDIEPWVAA